MANASHICLYQHENPDAIAAAWTLNRRFGAGNVYFIAIRLTDPVVEVPVSKNQQVFVLGIPTDHFVLYPATDPQYTTVLFNTDNPAAIGGSYPDQVPNLTITTTTSPDAETHQTIQVRPLWIEQTTDDFKILPSLASLVWTYCFGSMPQPLLFHHLRYPFVMFQLNSLWNDTADDTVVDVETANTFAFWTAFSDCTVSITDTKIPNDYCYLAGDAVTVVSTFYHSPGGRTRWIIAPQVAPYATRFTSDGYFVVSVPYDLTEIVRRKLLHQHPDGCAWFWDLKHSTLVKLWSTERGPDVGAVARQYGGGGTATIAAFELPFTNKIPL